MAKEDKKKKKRPKTSAKKAEQEAETAKASASKEAKFGTFPVPRRIVVNPELTQKYVKPGYLQFINGTDRRFQTQAVEWAAFHPDFKRPFYDEEEIKTALPISWPPNVTLLAPEQQASGVVAKPVHGGRTWPGHPAPPKLESFDSLIQQLPAPLRRFFSS